MVILESFSIKISIGLLLLRIFGTVRAWKWMIWTIMILVSITSMISLVVQLAQCRPLRKLWNPAVPGSCWRPEVVINGAYFNDGKPLSQYLIQSDPQSH